MRPLSSADRPLLREATLANMNWNGQRFTFDDVDGVPEISHYFSSFPSGRDFGLAFESDGVVSGVAWLVFLPADDPGYGFVDVDTPELSITTRAASRGQGVGSALLAELIRQARSRGIGGISLSVEDGNGARRIYERAGFEVVGRTWKNDGIPHRKQVRRASGLLPHRRLDAPRRRSGCREPCGCAAGFDPRDRPRHGAHRPARGGTDR